MSASLRPQQGCIDVSDAKAEQMMVVDQGEHLDIRRDRRLRKVVEQPKNLAAPREMAESEFADHLRLRQAGRS